MSKKKKSILLFSLIITVATFYSGCKKSSNPPPPPPPPPSFSFASLKVNGSFNGFNYLGLNVNPVIQIGFSAALDRSTVNNAIQFKKDGVGNISTSISYVQGDSAVIIQPSQPLEYLTRYAITVANTLKSTEGGSLQSGVTVNLMTSIDSSDKFPRISTTELLDKVQRQTFRYFWESGHPVSGMARERNSSGDIVTTGGTGFGIMAMIAATERGFITRTEVRTRIQKIVDFLETADRFHGAFPHWMNGSNGDVVPFSTKDNGADLVETSFLVMGLLSARQYFQQADPAETTLREDIDSIWYQVEWDWFRKGNENVLYWHWSPNYGWEMNHPIKGWNECLITYVLAASSPTHSIPAQVYHQGWASNGSMVNGNTYYGHTLPLGPAYGGPLFFAHYSFLGIDPRGLSDNYANYWTQNRNHALINYGYSVANPKNWYGYSDSVWGLTASDIPGGYTASSPTNDVGVIAPTAALASMPYTPNESMAALEFYYYKLGNKLWGDHGFYDAFSLHVPWFASSTLAIDQAPIIVMMENHRSGLLWNLFMSSSEIQDGMRDLSFQGPHL